MQSNSKTLHDRLTRDYWEASKPESADRKHLALKRMISG